MRVSKKKNCLDCMALVRADNPHYRVKRKHKYECVLGLDVVPGNYKTDYKPTVPCPKPKRKQDINEARKLLHAAMDENGNVIEQPPSKRVWKMERSEALGIAIACMQACDSETFPQIELAMQVVVRMRNKIEDNKEKERAYRESIPKRE